MFLRVIGGLTVRSIFVVIALALVGSLGEAAAQSYPPTDYYTPPPPGYYPPPQPYSSTPMPPLDVGAPAAEQPGGP